jgi:hypothetical protein
LIVAACVMLPGCALFHPPAPVRVIAAPPPPKLANIDCTNPAGGTCNATISVTFNPTCKVTAPTITVHAPNTTIVWAISPAPPRPIHFKKLSIVNASIDFGTPMVTGNGISVLDKNTDGLQHDYMMYFDLDACDFDPIIVNKNR